MLYGGAILFTISKMAHIANQDAWLAAIMALLIAYPIVLLALASGPRDVNTPMPHWIERLLGTFLGRLVNLSYMVFFMINGAIILRSVAEVIGVAVLPLTPRAVVIVLFAFPAAIAARLGIEVIARTAQIYIIVSLVALVILTAGIGPTVDLRNIQPILTKGLGTVFKAAIPSTAILTLVFLGLWCTPYLRERRSLKPVSIGALVVIAFVLVLSTLFAQGIFTYRGVEEMLFPILTLTRSIRLGRVVERLDVFLIGPWLLVSFVTISFFVYLASLQLAWIGGTRHYRSFSLPVATLVGVFALVIVRSDIGLEQFVTRGPFAPYVLLHTLVIPLLLFVVRLVRRPNRPSEQSRREDAT